MPELRLYLWEGVLTDYTDGVCFALASSPDEARALIRNAMDANDAGLCYTSVNHMHELDVAPTVISEPFGFALRGGG